MAETVQGFEGLNQFMVELEREAMEINLAPAMEVELSELEREHGEYFATATGPDGQPWAPLAPSTIKRKGHATILIDSDAMHKSLVEQAGDSIREIVQGSTQALGFGTHDPKSPFHASGTPRMPARPHMGMTEQYVDKMVERTADFVVEELTK